MFMSSGCLCNRASSEGRAGSNSVERGVLPLMSVSSGCLWTRGSSSGKVLVESSVQSGNGWAGCGALPVTAGVLRSC